MSMFGRWPVDGKLDWTLYNGRTNNSPLFQAAAARVERLIRNDAHALINGNADYTAGLIVAQLAHVEEAPFTEVRKAIAKCEAGELLEKLVRAFELQVPTDQRKAYDALLAQAKEWLR